MLQRGWELWHAFSCSHAAPQQKGWEHRSCLLNTGCNTHSQSVQHLAGTQGWEDTGTVAVAWACHLVLGTAAAKPSLLQTQPCKLQALILPTFLMEQDHCRQSQTQAMATAVKV